MKNSLIILTLLLFPLISIAQHNYDDQSVIYSNGVNVGIGTSNPSTLLNVSSGTSGDAVLKLEADTDNNNEEDNARIELMQDGGVLGAYIGFNYDWGGTPSEPDNYFRIGTLRGGVDSPNRLVINTNNGNVGIGTAIPEERLHVVREPVNNGHYLEKANVFESLEGRLQILGSDDGDATSRIFLSGASPSGDNKHWSIHHEGVDRGGRFGIGYGTSSESGNFWDLDTKFSILTNGNVGIGNTNPSEKMHISGGDLFVEQNDILLLRSNNGTNDGMGLGHVDGGTMKIFSDGRIHFNESDDDETKIAFDLNNGRIGIGSNSPSEKLEVDGKILAEEVRVENVPSSDYVFDPAYKLCPIEDVEAFVKQNKHLPGIPSATAFKENGVGLGEMDDLLLKKVEELTLYVIELKKENEELRKEKDSEISQLRKRIHKLEQK